MDLLSHKYWQKKWIWYLKVTIVKLMLVTIYKHMWTKHMRKLFLKYCITNSASLQYLKERKLMKCVPWLSWLSAWKPFSKWWQRMLKPKQITEVPQKLECRVNLRVASVAEICRKGNTLEELILLGRDLKYCTNASIKSLTKCWASRAQDERDYCET